MRRHHHAEQNKRGQPQKNCHDPKPPKPGGFFYRFYFGYGYDGDYPLADPAFRWVNPEYPGTEPNQRRKREC